MPSSLTRSLSGSRSETPAASDGQHGGMGPVVAMVGVGVGVGMGEMGVGPQAGTANGQPQANDVAILDAECREELGANGTGEETETDSDTENRMMDISDLCPGSPSEHVDLAAAGLLATSAEGDGSILGNDDTCHSTQMLQSEYVPLSPPISIAAQPASPPPLALPPPPLLPPPPPPAVSGAATAPVAVAGSGATTPPPPSPSAAISLYDLYEFVVMPFGLCNAPGTFQHAMNKIFHEYLDKFIVVYLDDILIFSRTVEEHAEHMKIVQGLLRQHQYKVNLEKCEFGRTKILYLGHEISADGLRPDDAKVASIQDWPRPQSVTEVRSFLGMTGYYRPFVKNYSTITSPLTDLTRLDTPWEWTEECEAAVRKLKYALTHYEVLKLPDPDKPFVVTTDASQYGIGAVLVQKEGPKLRPVEYMNKKMPSQKLAKSTYERELYALYRALVHWRYYLLDRFFYVRSDHETLRWIKTQPVLSDALKRWIQVIDMYGYQLDPIKGEYNKVADALSRRADYLGALVTKFDISNDLTRSLVEAYQQDPVISEIIRRFQAKDKKTLDEFAMVDGLLFLEKAGNKSLCVPNSESLRSLFLARWLSGLLQLQGYGHDFRAWAVNQKLEDFLKMVEDRWHDPQESQKATDVILTLSNRPFKSVRDATDVVERPICVPGVRYDPQVLPTTYLRCLPMLLRNQLVGEANINVHNFPSFSKKALDLDVKIGHGHQPTTDGRKKTLPPNWRAKGLIMFVDNDGFTIELDDDFHEGVGVEAGSVEASGGGAVAASVQKGKATGRRRGGSRSRSQVDPNAPPWEKAGLIEDMWRDQYTRQACIRCGQYGHNQFKCRNKKVTEKIPPTMGQAMGSSAALGSNVASRSGTTPGNTTVEEHVGHLYKVLSLLRQHQFKINGEKCEFGRTRILYLGHEISAEGLKPDDMKVASIRDWPHPHFVTEMRSFLGMTDYYRNFVKNFNIVAAPLTDLTRLDTPWEWTNMCEAAFRHLKHALTHHEVLKLLDPDKSFIVTKDAGQYGIGAVLAQEEGPKLRPIEYMFKKMPSQKLAKSTYEKELYVIYKALTHWRHYLLGRFFYVRTDHQTLKWMRTQPVLSDALKRWIEVIEQHDFEPQYIKGEYNRVADVLSCRPDFLGVLIAEFGLADDVTRSLVEAYPEDPFMFEIIPRLEAKDKATSAEFELVNGLLPGESLSMDFMDTLVTSKSGMRYVYVIVDRFSKYARLVAMPATAKIEYVIKLFKENWVRDFGLPKSIASDRDVRFTSELWKAAAAEQGTQLQMTSGNHPEANGQAEQLNRAVQHLLRHYIKPNRVDWDEKLALIASLYNSAVHSATGDGVPGDQAGAMRDQVSLSYPSEKFSGLVRYLRVAARIPSKTARDVALRIRWMAKRDMSKKRKAEQENLNKKSSKDKKDRVLRLTLSTCSCNV
ncbi:hypothetical protein CBR_g3305 [Chara braunii]|uniref:Integrase catalytic domain-containing protein n=1 Tax=Chara braunii TaxID=69332 RepID=A0A388KFC5_CHABU|nr:hypothetical protein CBR_g3305 [Chara braunii]|eukprot:GBG68765.1 hypothetical protein CBR_g3305 [Chara braunii]